MDGGGPFFTEDVLRPRRAGRRHFRIKMITFIGVVGGIPDA